MSGAAQHPGRSPAVEAYPYSPTATAQPCTNWEMPHVDTRGRSLAVETVERPTGPAAAEDHERRLAEETRLSFAAGRERGIEEGRAAECAAHAPAEQHRAEELRRLLEDLAGERDRYLQAVEHEVVRLALAIAARILRREAQTDPLLLMGAVRVALGQLAAATEVRLHVPAADAALWKESIALVPNPAVRPVVVEEDAMRLGECRLEASLGQADLSLGAQLDEIERVLFVRAAAPALAPAAAEALL